MHSLVGFTSAKKPFVNEKPQSTKVQTQVDDRTTMAVALADKIRLNQFPEKIQVPYFGEAREVTLSYTLDYGLQKEAERLLKSYKPDYAAIFMMDAKTGEVLAMSSFQKDDPNANNLNLQATFPAASIFKVITATAAVDKAGINPDHVIRYNGGAYTLYKKNVLTDKVNKWTNVITLRDAFARSINTAFGRLSLENLRPEDLSDYASRYMFNQEIHADFPVQKGTAYVPQDPGFELAEVASGYNKINRMSPVQGAIIAATIANDGNVVIPYVVDSARDQQGVTIYQGNPLLAGTIMSKESAAKVRDLMEQTVVSGTSRKSFRPIVRDRKFKEIEMGGKTGHLTGDNPRGRVDWFVGFALDHERKVAIAAVTVSKKYWTVKSSHLGQSMIRKFFGPIVSNQKNRVISAAN